MSVLHEFLAQHNPSERRLHLFVEGHDDGIFVRHFINQRLAKGTRVFVYRCDGKSKVFDVFTKIVERYPTIKCALFFVDKDIDDIVGTSWPTDPRIYVTDVYSIENYLTLPLVLRRFYANAVKLTGVTFDESTIFDHYDEQLSRFRRMLVPTMAWAAVYRQAGTRPILNNIKLDKLCKIDGDCRIKTLVGERISHLNHVTGVQPRSHFRRIVAMTRLMRQMAPERIVRGHFEAWFVVEFWKHLTRHLESLAREASGKVTIRPMLDLPTLVTVLTPHADEPVSLARFLNAHLVPDEPPAPPRSRQRQSLLDAVIPKLTKMLARLMPGGAVSLLRAPLGK